MRYQSICHQLWLATLIGMLFAILFLLIVRQYSFCWESTLLSDGTLMTLTKWLGWLPSMVGFSVPDAEAVRQSRLASEAMPLNIARQWQFADWQFAHVWHCASGNRLGILCMDVCS